MKTYLTKGNIALFHYYDKDTARSLSDELRDMIDDSAYINQYVLELRNYMLNFPRDPPPDADSFAYWPKEKFGLKPVNSVTHVTMYPRMRPNLRIPMLANPLQYRYAPMRAKSL